MAAYFVVDFRLYIAYTVYRFTLNFIQKEDDYMKKVVGFLKNLRFGFSEVDADLNGWEMLVLSGIALLMIAFVFVGGV